MKITMTDIRAALKKKRAAKAAGTWHGFAALKGQLSRRKGVTNAGGLAAWIGRKKFGRKAFAAMGAAGRKGMNGD